MNEFRAKQVKDGWAVIDDLGEACATYETLREAKREAMRLQGIWDRAQSDIARRLGDIQAELADLKADYGDLYAETQDLRNKVTLGVGA